ncbi:hypothetical protein [Crateriforma spongiae]|uniref:hypothetical protein n=1 Tax=Crateriforma spongiae TaxID=2724528 RepID=UPI0014461ED4|nr:hypothetical protein [Crateriforma spongiae]
MILGIAIVVVLVLVAIAILPSKKRDRDGSPPGFVQPFTRQANFRQQQLNEEAEAIADEYQRRADEAWRDELGEKAAALFQAKPTTAAKSRKS